MGNCGGRSFKTTQVATAKVVVHDGRLEEFSYPVKVSYLLQLYPACFICDSDDMAFDVVVTALHEDEVLHLGQLYFALPLNHLKRLLPPQEMAALAVTATSALAKCGAGKCGSRREQIIFYSGEGNAKPGRRVAPDAGGGDGAAAVRSKSGKSKSGGRGKGRGKFTATLSSIPEQG